MVAWSTYVPRGERSAKFRKVRPRYRAITHSLMPSFVTEQLASPVSRSGKGIIRPELEMFIKGLEGEQKDIQTWQKYLRAYKNVPLVAAGIDITTDNVVRSFHIVGENEEYKEEIRRLVAKFNMVEYFYNVTKQMLIFGNSFVEVVKSDEEIVDLKILPPITMFVNRDKFGNFKENQPDAYLQFVPSSPTEPVKFAVDEVVHYKFNPVGESAYGNSIIHPLLPTIQLLLNTESNMDVIMERYAAPLRHFRVGTPERPAQQKEIELLSSELEGINKDTELVTDDRVESKVLESSDSVINLEHPLRFLTDQLIGGLEVPSVLITSTRIDRATAEVQLDMFDRRSKSIQRVLQRVTEQQIFKVHLELVFNREIPDEDLPKLAWGEPEQRQGREEIQLIIDLKNSGIITAQKANSLLPEEFQEKLPKEITNPAQIQKNIKKTSQKEPSLDRIRTARDKRVPKSQKRGENNAGV